MKQERIQFVRDGLCVFLNYLIILAAVITILDLFQVGNLNLFLWMLPIVIPL